MPRNRSTAPHPPGRSQQVVSHAEHTSCSDSHDPCNRRQVSKPSVPAAEKGGVLPYFQITDERATIALVRRFRNSRRKSVLGVRHDYLEVAVRASLVYVFYFISPHTHQVFASFHPCKQRTRHKWHAHTQTQTKRGYVLTCMYVCRRSRRRSNSSCASWCSTAVRTIITCQAFF